MQPSSQNSLSVETPSAAETQSEIKPVKKAPGAFLTISEVADALDVQQHVLRFWETKFLQLKPLKRGGGRRYYRPEDVALLTIIHKLLYTDKYTIKGVQKLLKGQSKMQVVESFSAKKDTTVPVASNDMPVKSSAHVAASMNHDNDISAAEFTDALREMLKDLKELRSMIASH